MSNKVEISIETKRGCGYRTPGANGVSLYLMGQGDFEACECLPFPLTVCPCCGGGIGFSRGFKWIQPEKLFAPDIDPKCYGPETSNTNHDHHNHDRCAMCNPSLAGARAGLMWIGEKYYTPAEFVSEARSAGISKKVASIPRGFEFGKDIIYLAHIKAVVNCDDENDPFSPGVFMSFTPERVDIVIDNPDDIPARAIALKEKFGDAARLVVVEQEQMSLFL